MDNYPPHINLYNDPGNDNNTTETYYVVSVDGRFSHISLDPIAARDYYDEAEKDAHISDTEVSSEVILAESAAPFQMKILKSNC
jgi:hypothetical protein